MSDKSQEDDIDGLQIRDLWPVLIVLTLFAIFLLAVLKQSWPFSDSHETNGQFGDAFGALSSLFNGLAFAGLLITIVLQSRELRLQRKELRQTSDELAGQKKQLEYQSFAMGKQNFESTFFQLINLIDSRASQLPDPVVNDLSRRGRGGFVQHVHQFRRVQEGRLQNVALTRDEVHNVYVDWFRNAAPELSTYFQLISETISFLDASIIQDSHEKKQAYADILRAMLSPAEKHLIFYHALFGDDYREFGPLVVRYRLFEGPGMTTLFEIPEQRRQWYSELAG